MSKMAERGWFEQIARKFVPEALRDDEGIEGRRAVLTVKAMLVLLFWGPFFAAVYYFYFGSLFGTMVMLGSAVTTLGALAMMRWPGRPELAGNVMIGSAFFWVCLLSFYNGGLRAPSMPWLVLWPLFGLAFSGRRAGMFWLAASLVTFGGFYGVELLGEGAPQMLEAWELILLETLGMTGLAIVAYAIMSRNSELQGWLIDNLRARETETRTILETAPDGIVTIDAGGRIETANRAVAEMFDMAEEELVGQQIGSMVPDLTAGDDGPKRGEYTVRGAGGREFPVHLSVGEFPEDRPGAILVLRDISDQKRTEEELRRARDQAMEANQAKSTFLANMSHELRTPLNAIIGYSEMMMGDVESVGDEESIGEVLSAERLVGDLDRVKSAGDQLLALIDDVLDLSKIEAGQIEAHYETVDMRVFFDEMRSTLKPLAVENGNELIVETADGLDEMETDPQKVRQILLNLASNACKFTDQGTVRVEAARSDAGETVVFEVADTGIGMSDEELGRVFGAFSQADASTTREFGGTGLGLTIVEHFTDLLNGEVDVESAPGEGTTFTIRLPDEAVEAQAGADQSAVVEQVEQAEETLVDAPEADLRSLASLDSTAEFGRPDGPAEPRDQPLVLVVDDDPDVRDLLGRVIERAGFLVETASDGEEGLEKAHRLQPTAITLDVKMPGMDGWTFLSKLADDPSLSETPVVLVTMVDDRSHGLAVEADHYLQKPVKRQQLVEILSEYRAEGPAEVLLVEDDESTREMMRRNLADEDWEIHQATNGNEALDILDETTPTVVLLDLMMPEMDGFEFLARIRLGDYPHIPVVVVTAKELTERDRDVLDREVVEIVKKGGYDREELLEEVRTLVARAVG